MQNQILNLQRLLDSKGNIANPGYAKTLLFDYSRNDIKAPKFRIKEWDYYYIGNEDFALCLTVADMGYIGSISATTIDFKTKENLTKSALKFFPMGKINMPETSVVGNIICEIGEAKIKILNDIKSVKISGEYPKFGTNKETLSFNLKLSSIPKESMVIATPFKKSKHFYLNQKINCMLADGYFQIGDKKRTFTSDVSMATLDWGRGVWTYNNTWYWGSLSMFLNDKTTFGFNIGYGFGDTSKATENMLFYNGKSHKIDNVEFKIKNNETKTPKFMEQWNFTSSDGRFEMTFTPILDRQAPINLGLMCMIPHQVFGYYSGVAILDDKTKIEIKNALGFAEKVHNKW